MKKILMSAAAMIFAVSALSAQGPVFIGGGIGFDHTKEGNLKATNFTIQPQVGYMISENFGLALDLSYAHQGVKVGEVDAKNYAFGAGLTGIYTLKIADKFFYAPTLRVGFASGEEEGDLEEEVVYEKALKSTAFNVNLNILRFEFRPNCHWGFNFGFGGASFSNHKYKGNDATNNFNIGLLQGATIGFNYYF